MYHIPWAVASILLGFFFVKKLRNMDISTIPEMISHIFGDASGTLSVIIQTTSLIGITALQYRAGGSILAALLPEYFTLETGMIATVLVFMGITTIGGIMVIKPYKR